MTETGEELCDAVGDVIDGHSAGDILSVLAYLSGEVLAQCTDEEVDKDEFRDYMNLVHSAYIFNCGYTDATIQ